MVKLLNVYLNTVDQTKQDYHVRVYEERINDVCAVYIDGFSNRPLDSDLGAAMLLFLGLSYIVFKKIGDIKLKG
jgi:hypothetical protein